MARVRYGVVVDGGGYGCDSDGGGGIRRRGGTMEL